MYKLDSMLRLNRFIISKHLKTLSNVSLKSSHYYSSEPPDKVLSIHMNSPSDRKPERIGNEICEPFVRTTNSELNLFGPHDMRAPLNGNIGLALEDRQKLQIQALLQLIRNTTAVQKIKQINKLSSLQTTLGSIDIQTLVSDTPQSRCHKFFRILKYQRLFPRQMMSVSETSETVECSAHDLPSKVIKKFAPLFTTAKRHEFIEGLTVVTLSKRTDNDMSGYSEDGELERDHFVEQFISNANTICKELTNNGFWADFIDPYSGQPVLVNN